MRKTHKFLLLSCFALMMSISVSAQIKIKGVVTDEKGQPIPGVSIVVKGTGTGTITNLDGFYSISVSNQNSILVYSFIGYKKVEKTVGKQLKIDVLLTNVATDLDEVVVVGYGSMKKSDLTGSIVSLKGEDLQTASSESIEQALQGRASGVQVSTQSAAPGGTSNIRIRGSNSLLSDGNPLYIVDGFPVEADAMNSININNITNVEILKDASSTAIYGSRGSNGVILITTSKGSDSKPQFNFSSNFGLQNIYRKVQLLNGQQFAEVFNEYRVLNGLDPYYDGSTRDRLTPEEIGKGTDWYDQIIRQGFLMNYNLSVQGGTKTNKYLLSSGYYKRDGVILGGDFERFNFNINNDLQINKWLSFRGRILLSRTNTNSSGDRTGLEGSDGTLNNAMKMSPAIPVFDEKGNYSTNNFPGAQGQENPVAYANGTLNNIISDNILANVTFDITPIKDLDILIKLGTNISHDQNNFFLSSLTIVGGLENGQASITNTKTNYWTNEYILSYKKEFGKHRFNFTGGYTMEERNWESNSISGTGIPSDDFSYVGIGLASTASQPSVYKNKTSLISYLGRVVYNYNERYLVTLTNRLDGNSGFAEGKKWGNFPSISGAWRISQEKFMKKVNFLSNLKLRTGWGITGNSRIGTNRSLCLLNSQAYVLGDQKVYGIGPNSIGNENLQWESTEMYNVGLDIGLLKNRLTFTAEAYYKYTSDMLMSYDLPSTSGYTNAFVNGGDLENKGLEFSVSANIMNKKFKWNVNGNLTFNRNKVAKLYNQQSLVVDLGDKQTITINEGQPIRQFSGREILGVFKDVEDVNNYTWTNPETGITNLIQPTATPGDLKYADLNNDGQINVKDNKVYGSAFPDFTYGFNNQFKYANFTLDVFVTGSQGNWVYNRTLSYLRYTTVLRNNLSAEFVNRWTPENTVTNIPKIGANGQLPAFEDASYIRIQNIKLAYELPKKYKLFFDSASLYASVDNLYVWTKYSGWDPDVDTTVGGGTNINVGLDQNSYPRPRTITFGFNLKF